MTRIFLTGASGYIGGEVLSQLTKTRPGYKVRALVRDEKKAEAISALSSQVQVVLGSLDDEKVITEEAAGADVVLHLAATGHLESVKAIRHGLSARASTTQKPTHWIQISGATALAAAELADGSRTPGSASDLVFNDLDAAGEIRGVIQKHPGRAVDNFVLGTTPQTPLVKTALIFGPIIYGEGNGPVNQRSVQIPSLARATLQRRRGLQVGSGLSRWGNVHVSDIGKIILLLVDKAVHAPQEEELWGSNGLYLAGVGELSFQDISRRVAAAAQAKGLADSDEVDQLSGEEANSFLPHAAPLFGTNGRGKALKAEKLLGWTATAESLEEEIPRAVAAEAKALGLA